MATNKNTTSIVDISEIEDDEAPLDAAGPEANSTLAAHRAGLYLYHEDAEPQQRIANLISSIKCSAGRPVSPGQTLQANSGAQHHQLQLVQAEPSAASDSERVSWRPAASPAPARAAEAETAQAKANLGTLSGVYFPCVQNIFGVILFIRMVWIVGTAGVPAAFSLVFICCCVTLTTSISLSAIATNGIVPAGGSYFMISRSLGPECGGAVGTLFFLGTTVAGAMYITGAVEIMLNYLAPSWGLFGDFQRDVSIMYNNIRVYGSILLLLVGLLVWVGVRFVSKLAPVALFCVLLSILSIYLGIFINYNGRPDLFICVVGDRLVTLKNMPYFGDAPMMGGGGESVLLGASGFSPANQSANELAELEMRRTRALCTFDKLRYVFCPGPANLALGEQGSNSDTQADQQQQQQTGGQNQQQANSKINWNLFRNTPNMSNCEPYFKANRERIRLERAVPGLASGVLLSNLRPRFRTKGSHVSYDEPPTGQPDSSTNGYNYIFVDITTSFTILISIYFPSCTGILAGSNRSGDLADAQRSIPLGTLAAQLTTSFVYLSCIVLFGSTFNNLFIRDKFGESMGGQLAVTQIAWPHPYVILIGGLLSTLGAALQSLVGAPRVLQGIAKDEVIPCFNRFAKLSDRGEPERAILFTLAIGWLAVLIGNLDFIAPILTISLVMCYFFINLACTLHSLLGSPNWRPRFKHYHWSISTLGCLLCLFVMIVSSLAYFLVAIFLASCIYKYIEFSGAEKEWGDGKQGLALSAARYNLLRLKTSDQHTKNWRPQLLLFVKLKPASELEPASVRAASRTPQPDYNNNNNNNNHRHLHHNQQQQRHVRLDLELATPADQEAADSLRVAHPKLLTFASQLKAGKGLTLVSSVVEGDFKARAPLATRARHSLQDCMRQERVKGFADVLIASSLMDGLSYQVQSAGLGGLKHNTVILGWPEHWRRPLAPATGPASANNAANNSPRNRAHLFVELLRQVEASQNALLVIKGADNWPDSCDRLGGSIDIWWIVNDGGLLMLLAHLLRQHRTWRSCKLRIFTVASPQDDASQMRQELADFLYQLRIEAQVDIVEMNNSEISDYAYERTLMMEQRAEIMKRLNAGRKQSLLLEQELDGRVIWFRVRKPSAGELDQSDTATGVGASGSQSAGEAAEVARLAKKPDEANVRRMQTALALNEAILKRSKDSKLVIINLPGAPKSSAPEPENNYMEFIEIITDKLERVLLVQNGGREVITIHS